MRPAKRMRRNATSVMAGAFDIRPARDVLTSLLNGVPPYYPAEKEEEARRIRKQEKREKRERDKERRRQKALGMESGDVAGSSATPGPSTIGMRTDEPSAFIPTKLYASRPTIQFATCSRERSESVTPPSPPPMPSSPYSTPGPSNSSSTSRTSSKRPRTPDDDEEFPHLPMEPRIRKKRPPARKGWKGWVEGSPPPSEKLINLDAVPILQERRTRSGKNFDAIGVGKDGWV